MTLKQMTKEEIKQIVENHQHWLTEDCDGWENMKACFNYTNMSCANLSGVDLSYADFEGANLKYADFEDANLNKANFKGTNLVGSHFDMANLCDADFTFANLSSTRFHGANLSFARFNDANFVSANFEWANLKGASFGYSNLSYVNFKGADCKSINLCGTNLCEANFNCAKNIPYIPMACPEEGSFIGYKKCTTYIDDISAYCIVKLKIPTSARRSSGTTRKCRCDKAKVLSITSIDGSKKVREAYSCHNPNFIYKVGKVVEEPKFDDNRWNECSTGIHFFLNRQEAIDY